MPRVEWKVALKAIAGFIAGLALWILATPSYNRLIAASAERTLRAFEKPPVTRLRPVEDERVLIDRSDFDPRSRRPALAIRDLTFNVVLLAALFAASARTFSNRNLGGFILSLVILGLTHILGTIVEVMSFYSGRFGMWSTVNYSAFERNFWGVSNHFYRLVFMYAIAFALWWVFRDTGAAKAAPAGGKKKRKK